MARSQWSKDDLPWFSKLGGIFIAIWTIYGFLNGDGFVIGAMAGALMFMIVVGVAALIE
jgi:hypothetical protein